MPRKKLSVTIAGLLTIVLNQKLGLDLPPEAITGILGVVGLFNVGQGIADFGKESGPKAGPPAKP